MAGGTQGPTCVSPWGAGGGARGNVLTDSLRSRGSFEVEAHLAGTAGRIRPRGLGATVPWSRSREGGMGWGQGDVPSASRGPGLQRVMALGAPEAGAPSLGWAWGRPRRIPSGAKGEAGPEMSIK